MQSLRVGLFTEIYRPVVNGVVASVEALAAGLQRRGHEVFCFAPKMPGADGAEASVVRIPSLPLPARTPYRLTLPFVSTHYRDVIRSLSVVHAHSPFVTGWMAARYARRYGIPFVSTYHTQLEAYAHYVPFEPNATRFAVLALTRRFANSADAVIAPTAAMASRLRELGVKVRIEIVPSGIDVALFAAGRRSDAVRERAGAGKNDRLLLCVCRLAKEKNLELLLAALAHANDPHLKLAIAGDGPLRRALERRAREWAVLQQTRFLGMVGRNELPDLYASADAFVMPSTTETQGIVQAEALAAGALVISADAPQNRDVLGSEGQMVAPTAAAFAQAFGQIPNLPNAVRAQTARQAAQRFSIEAQIDRTLALYESLVKPAGSA
jgi:glycosyltransferase involved in cell wall biosynthesis